MNRRSSVLLATGLVGCLFAPAAGHEIRCAVEERQSIVITVTEEDGTPCAGMSYIISPKEGGKSVQSGRTDIQGRVVFVPESGGSWKLNAFSEHGHGTEVSFVSGEQDVLLSSEKPFFDRYARPITGVSLIFGIFGVLCLFRRRRTRIPSPRRGGEGKGGGA
jgi:nickel transport protein